MAVTSVAMQENPVAWLPPTGRNNRWSYVALIGLAVLLAVVCGILGTHSLKYGIGIVAVVAIVAAVVNRPALGGFILVAFVPTLSGIAPGGLIPDVRISEALIGLIGLTVMVSARRTTALRWGMLEWLLLAYGLFWAMLAVFDARTLGQHESLSQWGTVIGQLQFFILYRAVRITLRTPSQRRAGAKVLLAATAPMVLIAILQEIGFPGLRSMLSNLTGNVTVLQTSGIVRASGLFGNWASLAGYLFPILLLLVALGLSGSLRRHRTVAVILGSLMALGILLATELSILICLVLGILVLGIQYKRFRTILFWVGIAAAVAICIVGPVLGSRLSAQFDFSAGSSRSAYEPQTVSFRENVWKQQYLPAIAQRPLDGYGVQLPSTVQWPYPESQYIEYLVEGGYPLMVMYLLLLCGMYIESRRASRSPDPFRQALGRSLAISVVSLLFIGIIWPFVSNGGLPQVLWCLLALAAPARTRFERYGPPSATEPATDPTDFGTLPGGEVGPRIDPRTERRLPSAVPTPVTSAGGQRAPTYVPREAQSGAERIQRTQRPGTTPRQGSLSVRTPDEDPRISGRPVKGPAPGTPARRLTLRNY